MNPPTSAQTEAMQALFNRLTKQDMRYTISNHFVWEMFLSRSYTESDLKLVTDYIWRRIKAGKRGREAFRFSALIGNLDNFNEELALATSQLNIAQKEASRPKVAPAKAAVLRATFRPEDAPKASPEQVKVHVAKLLAEFRERVR